jgi:hypothetical protein
MAKRALGRNGERDSALLLGDEHAAVDADRSALGPSLDPSVRYIVIYLSER